MALTAAGSILAALTSLLMFASVGPSARAETAAQAYVLSTVEVSTLLGGTEVRIGPTGYENWDASIQYVLPGFDTDLFISASVLASDADARGFVAETLSLLRANNEKSDVRADADAPDFSADELYQVRLIYREGTQRLSEYGRLIRVGRTVAIVEAIGGPDADDQGLVDNDRALAMTRAFELVVGKIHYYPAIAAAPRPDMTPFAREWGKHGLSLSVDPTGHGDATWRVYSWCSDDPRPPCDRIINSTIEPGGSGAFVFHRVSGRTAYGMVIGSTDPESLPLGPITLTVGDQGMAELNQSGSEPTILCGPDYLKLAPPQVQAEFPCGA